MSRLRMLATLTVGALAATVVSVAPAHAADWRTRLTYQDGRGQVCVDLKTDGTATVFFRMNNRRGELKLKALISSVRADGKPDRTLKLTHFAEAGEVSKAASYDGLRADDLFFVEISQISTRARASSRPPPSRCGSARRLPARSSRPVSGQWAMSTKRE